MQKVNHVICQVLLFIYHLFPLLPSLFRRQKQKCVLPLLPPKGWEFLCIAEDPSEVYYTNIPQPGAHCVLKYKSLNMAMWVEDEESCSPAHLKDSWLWMAA